MTKLRNIHCVIKTKKEDSHLSRCESFVFTIDRSKYLKKSEVIPRSLHNHYIQSGSNILVRRHIDFNINMNINMNINLIFIDTKLIFIYNNVTFCGEKNMFL